MKTMDQLLDEWEDEYKPVQNHIKPDSSWSGTMFETYGEEEEYIYSLPEEFVWTWLEGDDGTYLSAGRAYINRLGYFVTEKPWTDFICLQVDSNKETCDECGRPTDNGFGHWQEELGNDHPQAEDRLCTKCYESIKEA